MQDFLRAFFHYSRTERNGFLVLAFLCLAAFLAPSVYRTFRTGQATDFSNFQQEIQAFEQLKKSSDTQNSVASNTSNHTLFDFDPNTAGREDLQRLGLPDRVIKTIINYRNKGGQFKTSTDLKKVYGLADSDFERLKDYVQISTPEKPFNQRQSPVNENNKSEKSSTTKVSAFFNFDPNIASKPDLLQLGFPDRAADNLLKFREKGGVIREKEDLARIYGITETYFEQIFPYIEIKLDEELPTKFDTQKEARISAPEIVNLDVNIATPKEWQQLYGIGPKLSERIIKFRDRLGGFYTLEQVGETYGLPDSVFQSIQSSLQLETPHQRININTATKEMLASHPYLNKKQAGLIINYRLQHGAFGGTESFDKIIGLPAATKKRILPYLSFE